MTVTAALLSAVIAFQPQSSSSARTWGERLFDSTAHDFQYVARGAVVRHSFLVTNRLDRRVHIDSVEPSCPVCSVAKPAKVSLEPGESTQIDASINTLSFTGPRSVAITVTFDQPQFEQVRLTLQCYSRSDIVINPGEVNFGTQRRGEAITRNLTIAYAGTADWKIASATAANPDLQVALAETNRGNGRVDYRLSVMLNAEAAPGSIHDRVVLTINDAYNKTIELPVFGVVVGDVTLSQRNLSFGTLSATNSSKQVVVRGSRPFRITRVDSAGGPFSVVFPDEARKTHFLKVVCNPDKAPGELSQDFEIVTDLEPRPLHLHVTATK